MAGNAAYKEKCPGIRGSFTVIYIISNKIAHLYQQMLKTVTEQFVEKYHYDLNFFSEGP